MQTVKIGENSYSILTGKIGQQVQDRHYLLLPVRYLSKAGFEAAALSAATEILALDTSPLPEGGRWAVGALKTDAASVILGQNGKVLPVSNVFAGNYGGIPIIGIKGEGTVAGSSGDSGVIIPPPQRLARPTAPASSPASPLPAKKEEEAAKPLPTALPVAPPTLHTALVSLAVGIEVAVAKEEFQRPSDGMWIAFDSLKDSEREPMRAMTRLMGLKVRGEYRALWYLWIHGLEGRILAGKGEITAPTAEEAAKMARIAALASVGAEDPKEEAKEEGEEAPKEEEAKGEDPKEEEAPVAVPPGPVTIKAPRKK